MSITNSQQLSIQITDCPRTEAVAPFFRMEGTEWWRHNTPLILLCETLERENAALRAERAALQQTIQSFRKVLTLLANSKDVPGVTLQEVADYARHAVENTK